MQTSREIFLCRHIGATRGAWRRFQVPHHDAVAFSAAPLDFRSECIPGKLLIAVGLDGQQHRAATSNCRQWRRSLRPQGRSFEHRPESWLLKAWPDRRRWRARYCEIRQDALRLRSSFEGSRRCRCRGSGSSFSTNVEETVGEYSEDKSHQNGEQDPVFTPDIAYPLIVGRGPHRSVPR